MCVEDKMELELDKQDEKDEGQPEQGYWTVIWNWFKSVWKACVWVILALATVTSYLLSNWAILGKLIGVLAIGLGIGDVVKGYHKAKRVGEIDIDVAWIRVALGIFQVAMGIGWLIVIW